MRELLNTTFVTQRILVASTQAMHQKAYPRMHRLVSLHIVFPNASVAPEDLTMRFDTPTV
ncbi:MAG: hypothetical protein AAGA61_07335 [Pseudomonadota bacterium]